MKTFKFTLVGAVASALLVPALSMAQSGAAAGASGWDGASRSAGVQALAPERLLREGPPLDTLSYAEGSQQRYTAYGGVAGALGRSSAGQAFVPERLLREGPPLDTMPAM